MKLIPPHSLEKKQHGAAFLVMLVILVVGIAAILVGSLSTAGMKIGRDARTAEALAQAKEALIARAVTDANTPGRLPCPDKLGDGIADSASDCTFYTGRLPWKTLGLPELRDGNGEPLWYALSKNFRNTTINSDTIGDLTLAGSPSANQVIAIVFAPGASIGQSRSESQNIVCPTTGTNLPENLCAAQYLEDINAALSTKALPNKLFRAGDATPTFNDQVIYITADNLLPPVEKRIAREVKQCLDDYAALPDVLTPAQAHQKYPWAVPVANTDYLAVSGTLFGRMPSKPTIPYNPTDPSIKSMLTKLDALQTALDNYKADNNSTTRDALKSAGDALKHAAETIINATSPAYSTVVVGVATPAKSAGSRAENLAEGNFGYTIAGVQEKIDAAKDALSKLSEDSTMPANWPASCTILTSSYWNNWRELVFYSVADGFRPNGSKSCGTSCLTLNGSGNPNNGSGSYRSVVLMGSRNLAASRTFADSTTYLEGANSAPVASRTLETYRQEDQTAKHNNDLVICLDGKGITSTSKCY